MVLIADMLLAAGAVAAAFYCFVLGRRLRKFNDLENGMGGAVAVLSAQVDDLEKSLAAARSSAHGPQAQLLELIERAEDVRRQLELQIASLHDIVPTQERVQDQQFDPNDQNEPEQIDDTTVPTPNASSGEPMFVRHRVAKVG